MNLRAVAYHEAGHAVARTELRLPLRWVTIIPSGDDAGATYGGHLPKAVREWIEEGGYGRPAGIRDRLEREVMAILAGEVAQEIATGTTEGSAQYDDHPEYGRVIVDGDWHRVVDVLEELTGGDDEEVPLYSDLLRLRTQRLLRQPYVWAHVEVVAEALLGQKRLTGREVRDLRRPAGERALAGAGSITRGSSVPRL
jgi:hypothetical protein